MHDAASDPAVSEKPGPISTPALEYEQRNTTISRRQYRVLLTLTLLNTILLAGFVAGPVFLPFARQQWQQFQVAREQRRRQAQQRAAYAQELSTPLVNEVVLDENPQTAAKLLADGSKYRTARSDVTYIAARPWQSPALLKSAPAAAHLADAGMVFLHGLKDPSGAERLVGVFVDAVQRTISGEQGDSRRRFILQTERRLVAFVIEPDGKQHKALNFQLGRETWLSTINWTRGNPDWEHGQVEYNVKDLFRIYAAKLDPSDPSKFTIDYDVDDHHGTIDGRLVAADRVELTPREGAIVNKDVQGRSLVWDPHVAPIPATQPSNK